MSILAWLVVGFLAGWIANLIMSNGKGNLLVDIILGIVGAIAGGFIMGVITGRDYVTGFNFETILVSVLGAIVVVGLYRLATGKSIRA
jgi:uncharacterized membrane protein YeaQ/YmgE (transglycosylase-associated protein family)